MLSRFNINFYIYGFISNCSVTLGIFFAFLACLEVYISLSGFFADLKSYIIIQQRKAIKD